MIRQEVSRRSGLPGFFIPGMMLMGRILFGIDLALVRPLEAVKEIRCPALFIHGQDDELVDSSHSVRLFEAAKAGGRDLWLVPNAAHGKSYVTHLTEYAARVQDFLSRAARQKL